MGERISEADACHQGRLVEGVPAGACTRFCLRRTKGRSASRAGEREQESTQSREWHRRKWAARRVEAATHPERVRYAAPSLSTERVTQDLQQRVHSGGERAPEAPLRLAGHDARAPRKAAYNRQAPLNSGSALQKTSQPRLPTWRVAGFRIPRTSMYVPSTQRNATCAFDLTGCSPTA
jgi:hypothetical protein